MELFTPSVGFVDAVLNHPRIRGTMQAGTERLSASSLVDDCIWRAFEGGWMLFKPEGDKIYSGHVAILPNYRGVLALRFGHAAITELFGKYGGRRLEAAAPRQLPSVRGYCRRLGLKPEGVDLFQEYFSMEAESWAV